MVLSLAITLRPDHFSVSNGNLIREGIHSQHNYSQDNRAVELKCSAILGDFFMKSETVVVMDKRTNVRMVEVKSENVHEESEKILGLFEDNSFREEEIFLGGSNANCKKYLSTKLFIISIILTLLSNFRRLSQT